MTKFNSQSVAHNETRNTDYIIDVPDIMQKNGDISPLGLVKELQEYIFAIEEKVVIAEKADKKDIANILSAVATDMKKIIRYYEEGDLSFNKCYEEVVSLYVFVEIYINLTK